MGDTLALQYSTLLEMVDFPTYTIAKIRNPWNSSKWLHTYVMVPSNVELPSKLPSGTIIRIPIKKAVVYTSVHASLLYTLGAQNNIGGVCDLKYINLPYIQDNCKNGNIVDCGEAMNPDIEKIIDLQPDALLLSPFQNSGGYGRVEELDIPIIECADYMENSALGRAEWMKFYGKLFGVETQALHLFNEVDSCYQSLKEIAQQSTSCPTIVSELKNGSAWYVPGGQSVIGILFNDAKSCYAFSDDQHTGSIPLSFETVYDKAGDSDYWIFKYNRNQDMTYDDLKADFEGYAGMKAFKERNVYGCNTNKVAYYEEVPFRPDYLLKDLIQITHPEIRLGGLKYYKKLD